MAELYKIYDVEENTYFKVCLSLEDLERVKNDSYFANSVAEKAKLANEKNLVQPADSNKIVEQNKTLLETNSLKTNWTYEQTTSLIKSMENYKDDLEHPMKRKNVFENVSNDMLSSGYEVDINAIKNKWKSLTRSYTKAKDNKNRTGRGPARFFFFNAMDEVLGTKPTNSCNCSINSLIKKAKFTPADDHIKLEASNKIVEQNKTPSETNSSKPLWTYEQTKSLIKSMENHKDDLDHPMKRKNVFEKVSNDMLSSGYTVDINAVKNKWKSLTRSYTTAKDNKNRTGQDPSRFNFFILMDAILGSKPTNSFDNSINSTMINSNTTDHEYMEPLQDGTEHENYKQSEDNPQIHILVQDGNIPLEKNNVAKRGKESLKLQFIQLKEKEYERRQQRHEERIKIEQERLELENNKMLLLREYLKHK